MDPCRVESGHVLSDVDRHVEQWLIGHTGELTQAGTDLDVLRAQAREHRHGLAHALDRVLSDWFARNHLA